MEPTFAAAKPGRGHRALASLYRAGKTPAIITQNIDNLHQASGFKADDVIELHGNTTYARCIGCGQAYDLHWVKARFDEDGSAPDCTACDEPVKTATISFGQAMPEDEMRRATELAQDCDLFLAIGSSLVVWPAAGFPIMAKRNGAKLVIINREPTEQDDIADLVIRATISARRSGPLWVIEGRIDLRPVQAVHSSPAICFLAMRRKRKCYLLIREIRAALS